MRKCNSTVPHSIVWNIVGDYIAVFKFNHVSKVWLVLLSA